MRKILVVGTVVLVVLVAVYRQRIFLRDPLGKVERNGVQMEGARVFINYSNDVLVEDAAEEHRILVQGWSGLPGTPKELTCLRGLLCVTEADEAPVVALGGIGGRTRAVMSNKEVSFVDGSGAEMRVDLR